MRNSVVVIACLLASSFCNAQISFAKKSDMQPELISSGVKIDNLLSAQQKENLFVLGKTWGFLKYYHPDAAKGSYNFDSCLFSILPTVLKAGNKMKRDELLFNWIGTLGDENRYAAVAPLRDSNLHTKASLAWLNNKDLFSEKLIKKLNNIYLHRNTDSSYYVKPAEELNPSFANEARYKSVPAEDDGFRMLALFRYWNIIEYFFPYKHLFKENWSDVLKIFCHSLLLTGRHWIIILPAGD
jgi:hypothetical protein